MAEDHSTQPREDERGQDLREDAFPSDAALDRLAERARTELADLSYPAKDWIIPKSTESGTRIHAVIIVGAGQSGLVCAAALHRDGVRDVILLDGVPAGQEGVWDRFARMEELRTPKATNGMEFGCPSLSIQAWYETCHGAAAWAGFARVPRRAWADYLKWYQKTLDLRIESETRVVDIREGGLPGTVDVVTQVRGQTVTRHARTVVIATGFDGAGAWRVPSFVSSALPRHRYDHTNGPIDFAHLKGARVGILGHGASAFDNANVALQACAARVDLCFRRAKLPRLNPHRHLEDAGTMTHYPWLPPETRWRVARHFRRVDQPPPPRGFATALAHPDFHLHPACPWLSVREQDGAVIVETPRGALICDHLLCATGLEVDLSARPELTSLLPEIALWRDHYTPPPDEADERLGGYPFLEPDFSFMPREARAGWVGRVFCFNTASAVSQGPHATSISGHRHALPRLVRGVTGRLFAEQTAHFITALETYAESDLDIADDFEVAHILPHR